MCIVVNYTYLLYNASAKAGLKLTVAIGFIGESLRRKEKIGRKEELSVFHHQPIRSFCAIQQL